MINQLKNLEKALKSVDLDCADQVKKIAGRYERYDRLLPIKQQPAYKYIMYLKLMRNIPNSEFHYMKRKYLNTSMDIQNECLKELQSVVRQDAKEQGVTESQIYEKFYKLLR